MIYGGWEPDLHEIIQQHVRPGSVVYDLGANFGIYTLLFAKLVGPTGKVYAFEPMEEIMAELQANVELNRFSNVEFVRSAVSDTSGFVEFRVGDHAGSGHLESADACHVNVGKTLKVPTTSLDDFVQAGAAPPSFIKIDIEGAEGLALTGASQLLTKHRPMIAVEVHSPEQSKIVGAALARAAYSGFLLQPNRPAVDDLANGFPVEFGHAGYLIAVPN
jgi:FkbM family methyltransferase